MKRKIKFAIMTFAFLLVSICMSSCYGNSWPWCNADYEDYENYDSILVAEQVEKQTNPSFVSVEDVMSYKQKAEDVRMVDEIFTKLPSNVLRNVTTVCLSKYKSVTKSQIVSEYTLNKDVYDNLPKKENKNIKEEALGNSTTSIHYEIDTIDGKPAKVKIKEERTYEHF